ncbi:hypothetical protein EJ08DRAFT_103221 [Tothia fuscella]|uniref:Uncharacterized protein n=1 Tax=Tothia fuscella TaxID=1048955 RepID=A0A9P4NXH0_9PEZI|nr:hypothetical protein EJ08DRAFT_103221 [Tothia fuscella]
MSSIISRSAFRATRPLYFRTTRARLARDIAKDDAFTTAHHAEQTAGKDALKKGARKDPELYVLLTIMTGVFGLAGWHFSRSPTGGHSEGTVAKVVDSEPWKSGRSSVYQYHPGGDPSQPKKDAPSPLNSVIVPNVNLPKSLHEQFNKYGKDGY